MPASGTVRRESCRKHSESPACGQGIVVWPSPWGLNGNYPWADLDRGVVLDEKCGVPVAERFREYGGYARRPLFVSEWSFPALDTGRRCLVGAGQRFHTQAERAQASEMLLRTVMALPFLVGDDFFMWQDDPALGVNKDFHENSNYGLVNVNDEP